MLLKDFFLIHSIPVSCKSNTEPYLSQPRTVQFWASAMVVLPVFLQAPWVHFFPASACLFTFVILGFGIWIAKCCDQKWFEWGSLFVGVSASWLGGSLFWGWLRANPIFHLPVEAIALPLACAALTTRWRIGASFYLASLLGTALTDLMMALTGVIHYWPEVLEASLEDAPKLLNLTAAELLNGKSFALLFSAILFIGYLSRKMRDQANLKTSFANTWLVASAALTTTVWIDALFFLTALFQPNLSGLI